MKKPNFTDGDWKVVNDETYPTLHQIWGSDGCMPVYIARTCYAVRSEQNAKLIASAPEMFDLLATIENDDNKIPDWLWKRIQNLLNKITN